MKKLPFLDISLTLTPAAIRFAGRLGLKALGQVRLEHRSVLPQVRLSIGGMRDVSDEMHHTPPNAEVRLRTEDTIV